MMKLISNFSVPSFTFSSASLAILFLLLSLTSTELLAWQDNAIKQFKTEQEILLENEGLVEIENHVCGDFDLDTHSECVVLWQWTQATTWEISISIINAKGQELDSVGFGRKASLLEVIPYSRGSLILAEHSRQQGGDVSCCPSVNVISLYRWKVGKLQPLADEELPETRNEINAE